MSIDTQVHHAAATHAILHSPDGLLWCDRAEVDTAAQTITLFNGDAAVITFRCTTPVTPGMKLNLSFNAGFRVNVA